MRYLILSAILLSLFVFWQTKVSTQGNEKSVENTEKEQAVTVKAEKRGAPFVNFKDGVDAVRSNGQLSGEQPVALVSADFDSDGVADLVTADKNGRVRFYHGNANARRNASETETADNREPFDLTDKVFAAGVSPDYLAAGDFNADGRQDIVAAAKGANFLVLLSGDGRGNFSQPNAIAIDGQITAFAAGEIGRADGQTDLAVAFINKNGAFLAVFEHPEGAFKHKPEIFKLPAPATDLAIGNLDDDSYADIAVACGSVLTIVQGRGQAYPWDLSPELGIKRPAAVVANRQMPFQIAALAAGNFSERRGASLALLGVDGSIYHLESQNAKKAASNKFSAEPKMPLVKNSFLPTDAQVRNIGIINDAPPSQEEGEKLGLIYADADDLKSGKYDETLKKKQDELIEKFKNSDKKELEKTAADNLPKILEQREQAKQAFLNSIAAKPSTLAKWNLQTLVANSQFVNSVVANSPQKMLRARVSDGGADDIILLDSVSNQIQIVARTKGADQRPKTEIVSLDVENSPLAVLPMRLNKDALSDLVVLRRGAEVPSVVMSAPSQIITVNSANDDFSNCQNGGACTLRGAITLANSSGGAAEIDFNIAGGGLQTIALASQLPTIIQPVTIDGTTQPGYNGLPLIEITGANAGNADGLKIRTSNATIRGLAINSMKSVEQNGSQIGGNGITIESTTNSPNNGFNVVEANFLGTDATGSFDKGNDATGLNIFDAHDNQIGGTAPNQRNVMSGNGSQQKFGVGISVTAGNYNIFEGNIIGLNSLGTGKVGNSYGLFFTGIGNTFGGDAAGAGNTVSGNGEAYEPPDQNDCRGYGMIITQGVDLDTGELLTLDNNLKGNRLGTNPAGTAGFGNCSAAITTTPRTQTIIGSITQNGRNIVSDNGLDAIYCTQYGSYGTFNDNGYCAISGNNIGTDVTGTISIPNDWRNQLGGLRQITGIVYIVNNLTFSGIGAPGGTTPGGACTGFCNLISGNGDGSDISVSSGGVGTVGVFSNFIGTNQNGSQALPNVGRAVVVEGSNTTYVGLGFPGAPPLGNLISGNDGVGVAVTSEYAGRYSRAYIEGNLIGTDTTGSFAISNSQNQSPYFQGGIYVFSNFSDQIFVGDTSPEARNIVSGNTFDNGISVYDLGGKTKVVNNLIGLNRSLAPLGNGGNGIFLQGFGTQIGGATAEEGNQIAYNGTGGNNFAGVLVSNGYFGNTIRNNSIHDNSGLGIDLTGGYNRGDGVTANDCLDADAGANDLQNFPVLFAPVQSGENVTVPSVLRSSPSQPFAIDFYSNQNADPSGYGEGATYIGTKVVTTDSNGFAQFNFTSSASVSANSAITATATDGYGSTSEFSCAAGQCTNGFSSPEEYMQSPLEDSCIAPIVVNVNTDDADANTADGVCDTDVNTPDLQCSLRAAIQEANARAGFSLINFNIPGGGVQTITITSALPQINKQIFILGDTQPGYSDTPLIKIDGSQTSNAFGLAIAGGNSTVRALTVVGFQQGIGLSGLGRGIGGNKVQACYVGINSDGVTAPPQRQQIGIEIRNVSPNNRIGGILPSDRNVVSNNVVGIEIDSGSTGNLIYGNYVGTDKTGTQAVPNDFGIVADTANNNQIGSGDIENGGNLISGNTVDGISLTQNSQGTRVVGNLIGTDANGTTPVPNKTGVEIASGASQNFIGGTTSSQRNIISGQYVDNNSAGIVIRPDAGNGNHITGNYIGVTKYQDQTLTNYTGIGINADNQIVGSADTNDFPNVIGGSTFAGVYVHALADSANLSVENTQILNNLIGTSDNASPLGNYEGIELLDNVSNTQIVGNTVGYNSFAGIRLFTDSHDNSVLNNKVGIFANDSPIPNDNGIVVKQSNNNTVNGNVVSGNTSYGIALGDGVGSNSAAASFDSPKDAKPSKPADNQLTENNSITANKVGTSDDGANVVANGEGGIVVSANAQNNTIGGSRGAGEGNIVGGHTNDLAVGIFVGLLDDSQPEEIYPQNNRVEGNSVGFGAGNEPASLPNGTGIYLRNAKANFIGGDSADKGNVVGNSNESGIRLFLATTTENIVRNNFVGVLPDGQIAANQGDGISIDAAPLTTVQENTVGGNAGNGISIANLNLDSLKNKPSAPAFGGILKAVGNLVGNMKISGITTTIPNQLAGILVKDTKNILIGIESQDESSLKNIFSGNVGAGILIQGDSSDNTINNSIIGTDETGAANLGNGGDGICLMNVSGITIGSRDIANVANAANVIAGNQGSGVMIQGGGGHGIFGNIIGSVRNITTGIDTKLPNQFGLKILDSVGNIVGDVLAPLGNTISGNTDSGILLQNSLYNLIKHNDIGTDDAGATDLGNGADGVLITDNSRLNTVGGTDDGAGNTIAYNGSAGVRIDETAGHCNVVDPNLIFGNVGLGVDIGTPGHTPNDPDDADSGANNLQNYPEIVSHEIINGELVVSYKVDSAPEYSNYGADGSQGLYVEFFKADASGNQGEKFLGSDSYTLSDYNGSLIGTKTINLGDINTLGITANDLITATATDADGNTSEFFPAMQPTAAPVSVGGRVLTATGRGIGNARVSLTNANGETRMAMTNAFGFYHFADVESGATYILSVAAKRYRFENPTRVLSVNEEIENADFVALP